MNVRYNRLLKYKKKYEGTLWESKVCGTFEILEYKSGSEVVISFTATGYETTARMGAIVKGNVLDKMYPRVYGVGFIGVGEYSANIGRKHTKSYGIWLGMLRRCYHSKSLERRPTYKDCTVIEEWHNFQNFAKWFEGNCIEGYQLDKDIKVVDNKVYGPDTCTFVTPQKNKEFSSSKQYKMLNPNGELIEFFNMSKFCRGKGLNPSHMISVFKGDRKQHKGWTRYKQENTNET